MATLVGLAENVANLGTFSGSTIQDNESIKDALQQLETATELRATIADSTLTGTTHAKGELHVANDGGDTHGYYIKLARNTGTQFDMLKLLFTLICSGCVDLVELAVMVMLNLTVA
mgnify:CR=1 FL=1